MEWRRIAEPLVVAENPDRRKSGTDERGQFQ
jgi:hypothetical protein